MRGSEILCLKTTVIDPLKQELQEADASVASAASEALESYKTTVNQKFDTVERNITALDSQLDTLSGSLSTMNETVSSLSGEVDSVAESVTTLAEEVSNEITVLENKLFGLVLPTAENVTYTGVQVSPEWNGYEPTMLTIGGQTSGTEIDTYTVTFTPVMPYRWTDGTMDGKEAQWAIV